MAIEGPLRELALSDVFQLLDLSRKTGTLTIHTDGRSKPAEVYFDRGAVVGIELPGRPGRLGSLLLRAGKITEGQLEAAVREQQGQPGRHLGEILVERGLVSEAEVRRQLKFQIEEAVCDLMGWEDGYFRFDEGLPDVPRVSVRVTSESLLMEAARRIDEWSTLEEKIPHMEVIPALSKADSDAILDLHPSEWEVLAEIDGRRTLRDVAVHLGRGDFAVAKIAYGLVSTGIVEIVERMDTSAEQREEVYGVEEGMREVRGLLDQREYARAVRMIEDLLQRSPERAELHLLYGKALLGVGRWRPAADALGRAAKLDPLSTEAQYARGIAAVRIGDFRQAREAWDTFLRLPDAQSRTRAEVERAVEATRVLGAIVEADVV